MGKNLKRAFLDLERRAHSYRPLEERIHDFKEVEVPPSPEILRQQAERCMDCGIPFCHGTGCPLGNQIPEFNEAVANGRMEEAWNLLSSTSCFPEFTSRICPALCEGSCTCGLDFEPVTVRQIERYIVDRAFADGLVKPRPVTRRTGKTVAVVGAGPAGLAAAALLNQAGHLVTVYERDLRPGGLLRYGIPDFKLDKSIIDRRIALLEAEGVKFETGVNIGVDISGAFLKRKFDAVILATGTRQPRDLRIPGRELDGILPATVFLSEQNRLVSGEHTGDHPYSARGKRVLVIGGGDTGSDCVGTSIRQGAASVVQIEIMPSPPEKRSPSTPWPLCRICSAPRPATWRGVNGSGISQQRPFWERMERLPASAASGRNGSFLPKAVRSNSLKKEKCLNWKPIWSSWQWDSPEFRSRKRIRSSSALSGNGGG